jgi:predicted nucleic acid-binding protein
MNVVDTSGWLEYFVDGTGAEHFVEAIEDTGRLVVPVITLYEVYKVVLRNSGEAQAREAVEAMRQGQVVNLDAKLAIVAAALGHTEKLALADSIILATARLYKATLWTQDAHFAGITGVKFFPKASSSSPAY